MESPPLYVRNEVASIPLVPIAIQLLRRGAELDDEFPGQILGLDFTTLFPPKPVQPVSVIAHDYPGVRAADERASIRRHIGKFTRHAIIPFDSSLIPNQIRKVSIRMSEKSIRKVSIRQIKAARALLGWSQDVLAEAADVSIPTVKRLEAADGPLGGRGETAAKIIRAIVSGGAEFIDENGGGPGVRLRKPLKQKR
jgi:DNA-binding XRE family transcriptional regulator